MTSYVWPANFHWHSAPPDAPFLQQDVYIPPAPPQADQLPIFVPGDDAPFSQYHPGPTRPPLENGEYPNFKEGMVSL